ncbi:MAG: hypothetical protein IKQ94_02190 [Bacteroidales bacterium]|nr:hypothetical protein [Bacteroidales bacterium]
MKKIFYSLVFASLAIIAGCTGRVQIENQIDCNVDPDEYFGQSYNASDFQFWRVLGEGEAAKIIDSLERVLGERADDEADTESGSRLVPVPDTAAFGEALRKMTLKFADGTPYHYRWLKDEYTGDYCELLFLYGDAEGRPLIDGSHVDSASVVEWNGQMSVDFVFDKKGAEMFRKLTAATVGERLAMTLGEIVLSVPRVNGEINGGRCSVSASDTEKACAIAAVLNKK